MKMECVTRVPREREREMNLGVDQNDWGVAVSNRLSRAGDFYG